MLQEVKPKNARAARALKKRAPHQIENPKIALFLRSTTSSSLLNSISADLYTLKKPLVVRFSKKNTVHPFEDPSSLEFFAQKNGTSLLAFSSHSKKRPHCLTIARCFDGRILDMIECLIQQGTARSISQFGGQKCRVGTKPLLSFSGTQFEDPNSSSKFVVAKSILLDFFRGQEIKQVDAEGLNMMMTFTAVEEQSGHVEKQEYIYMRVWRIITKRSGQKLPRVELEEMGPRIDFRLGRVQEPDASAIKAALKRAKVAEARPKKNIETDLIGDTVGRIHIGTQDLQELQTRKMKGLKRDRDAVESDGSGSMNDEEIEMEDVISESEDEIDDTSSPEDLPSDIKRPRLQR